MQINGEFKWRTFFLSFLTRKFLIAVGLQVVATFLAYYAVDQVTATALEAKVQGDQIVEIVKSYLAFTVANGGTFGLFNSTSKFAGVTMEKVKKQIGGKS